MKYFLLNFKSFITHFWHLFCAKINMDTQIELLKKAEKICKNAEAYLQDEENRDYIPSCDEFYLKYGYSKNFDILPLILNKELYIILEKIDLAEKVMLNRYAIMADPEYTDNKGVTHKFNKRELSKRYTKILNKK